MAHHENESAGGDRLPNETQLPPEPLGRASIQTLLPPEPPVDDSGPLVPPSAAGHVPETLPPLPSASESVPETLLSATPPAPQSAVETLPPPAPSSGAPAETLSHEPTPPDVLAERYRDRGPATRDSDVRRLDVPGFEVLGELGRGGMGVVYKARQVRLGRTVALKMILGSAHVNDESLARFQREAEAVAKVQHPNIVQIYEIGDHDGLPFFSLEFVEGGSLDRLVSGEPFPSRDVAGLVETIARAMHFAHERGIIHRDLKPANILLARSTATEDGTPLSPRRAWSDGGSPQATPIEDSGRATPAARAQAELSTIPEQPRKAPADSLSVRPDSRPSLADFVPKITDFGLAKQLEGDATATRSGAVMGTPSYMAPEQAAGRTREIGPLADVYALGAILYNLLTGRPPFRAESVMDTLRLVIESDPISPRLLNPTLDRDLETICLKCLEKDPQRRYPSALALASELLRYRTGMPIEARAVGRPERLARWAKRKPAVASLAGSVALLLVALLAGSVFFALYQRAAAGQLFAKNTDLDRANLDLTQSNDDLKKSNDSERAAKDEAKEQAAIALAVTKFFQNDVIRQADSRQQAERKTEVNPDLTLREALDRAAERIGDRFQGQELTEAAIRLAIGDAYLGVGDADKGIPHLERSVALRQAELGTDHPETLTSMNNLAAGYHAAGKLDLALPLLEETLKLMTAKLGREHPFTLTSMNNLAAGYDVAGKLDQALPLYEETLKVRKAQLGPDHPDTLGSMNNLALAYKDAGKLDLALPLMEETLKLMKVNLGLDHPGTLNSMGILAQGYVAIGKLDLALPLHEEALKLKKAKLGPEHPNTLNSMNNLAALFWSMKRLDRSIPLFEELLPMLKRKLGDEHPDTLLNVANLGVNYRDAGRLDEAIP